MTKPMLAAEAVLGAIEYPVYGSFKRDGVRGLVIDGKLMARSLKPIRNKYTSSLFSRSDLNGFDGELVVGSPTGEGVMTRTTSGVGRATGIPDVKFHVFDLHDIVERSFTFRHEMRMKRLERSNLPEEVRSRIVLVEHRLLHDDADLLAMEAEALAAEYEGLVLRDPLAVYKFGRSTELEGGFLRFVRWITGEAEILEVEESETNTNPKERNELGYAKRSSAKGGMVKTGSGGSLKCRELKTGVVFNIPLGKLKNEVGEDLPRPGWFWTNRAKVKGKIVRYRSRPTTKVAPRYPQLDGFRAKWDLS